MIWKHSCSRKSKAILQINPASVAALTAAALFVLLSTIEPLLTEVHAERERSVPLGLPPLPVPPDAPSVAALGKKLFFERRLSINDTMSCGMCHIEAQAMTSNDLATSVGRQEPQAKCTQPLQRRHSRPYYQAVSRRAGLEIEGRTSRINQLIATAS